MSILLWAWAWATTWHEPYTRQIVADAETFLLAEVVGQEAAGPRVRVIEVYEGSSPPGEFVVKEAGDGPVAGARSGARVLLLLDRVGASWTMQTPTSGAFLRDGDHVIGDYRISFHAGVFDEQDFVAAVSALWEQEHRRQPDLGWLERLRGSLEQEPVGPDGDPRSATSQTFFRQHLALEGLHYFGGGSVEELRPFVDSEVWHHRASSARALGTVGGDAAVAALLWLATDESEHPYVRLLAAEALEGLGDPRAAPELRAAAMEASDDEVVLATNLMDPRVGTQIGSVRSAMVSAVAVLEALPPRGGTLPVWTVVEEAPEEVAASDGGEVLSADELEEVVDELLAVPEGAAYTDPGAPPRGLPTSLLILWQDATYRLGEKTWEGRACACEPVSDDAEDVVARFRREFEAVADKEGVDPELAGAIGVRYRSTLSCPMGAHCGKVSEAQSAVRYLYTR